MAHRWSKPTKRKQRIDPRYFLEETAARGEEVLQEEQYASFGLQGKGKMFQSQGPDSRGFPGHAFYAAMSAALGIPSFMKWMRTGAVQHPTRDAFYNCGKDIGRDAQETGTKHQCVQSWIAQLYRDTLRMQPGGRHVSGGGLSPEAFVEDNAEELDGWLWLKSGVSAEDLHKAWDSCGAGCKIEDVDAKLFMGPKKFDGAAFLKAYKQYEAKERGIDYESPEMAQRKAQGRAQMKTVQSQGTPAEFSDSVRGGRKFESLTRDQLKQIILEVMSELGKENK